MGKKTRRRFSSKDKAKAVRSHLIVLAIELFVPLRN